MTKVISFASNQKFSVQLKKNEDFKNLDFYRRPIM